MSTPDVKVFDKPEDIFQAAAERFLADVKANVALSGGSTPKGLFGLLAQAPYRDQVKWGDLAFYWGDERCVPPDHADSNYRMAQETLLSKVPAVTVHRIRGEADPAEAAAEYEKLLPAGPFDLVLLGMGPDGHTASLFPHTKGLHVTDRRVTANFVDKLGVWRVSLTAPELQRAKHVLFMVTGADKSASLEQVLKGDYNPEEYPSQLLRNASGTVTWFLDKAAAAQL